jgi:hypothetical protein
VDYAERGHGSVKPFTSPHRDTGSAPTWWLAPADVVRELGASLVSAIEPLSRLNALTTSAMEPLT